jgi:GTP-binding protein Era
MKIGKVLLIGRPNVGKSTFVNNVIGQKVAITSPKPQTTRFPIRAIYQESRGKIIFVDTPGIIGKTQDLIARHINKQTLKVINEQIDVVLYFVDPTRRRDFEEAKVLGLVRKIAKPKILVFNKIDITNKPYLPQYEFLKEEFNHWFAISALNSTHFKPLLNQIFTYLTDKKDKEADYNLIYPVLNIDSKIFIAELIREKIFLNTGEEVPYTTTVVVDEIIERKADLTYIKARILTTHDRYKKMLIGKDGQKIKDTGHRARKEIELALNKKIYLDLRVETDPHWQVNFYK